MKKLLFGIGIALIITHGFLPNIFIIDYITILLFFILSLPLVAPYLKRAKIPGAEFEFKEEIKEAQKEVQSSIEKVNEDKKAGKYKILPFETFKVKTAKKLLESGDPILALAALRIEIERKLRLVADFLRFPDKEKMSIFKIIEAIKKKEMLLYPEQMIALERIINMCNKAIHGSLVSNKETKEIIELAEKLSTSFPVGYSIDLSSNTDYKKHELFCDWEHCIEWMPLLEKETEKSCPVFGHNCPGGTEKIKKCGKTLEDFYKDRSYNKDFIYFCRKHHSKNQF